MGLGGCYNILKYIVVLINTVFFISGVIITGLCSWILVERSYSVVQDANNYINGFIVLLVVGVLLMVVGTLGCCGACKESQCLLIAFFSVLLVVIVAQIATVVWGYLNMEQLHQLLKANMEKTVNEDFGVVPAETSAFDDVQRGLQCCGTQGPMDWATSKYSGGDGTVVVNLSLGIGEQRYKIPSSCCSVPAEDALCAAGRQGIVGKKISEIIYSEGCLNKLYEYMDNYRPLVLGLSITAGLLELLGFTLSLILCCAVRFVDRYKA